MMPRRVEENSNSRVGVSRRPSGDACLNLNPRESFAKIDSISVQKAFKRMKFPLSVRNLSFRFMKRARKAPNRPRFMLTGIGAKKQSWWPTSRNQPCGISRSGGGRY